MLAAMQLAKLKDIDSANLVFKASSSEADPRDRIDMALFAAQLGNQQARAFIKDSCSDPGLPASTRLTAADDMLQLADDTCLADVEALVTPEEDPNVTDQALSLLPRYEEAFPSSFPKEKIIGLISKCLGSKSATVRINASMALGSIGDSAEAETLKKAIADETDYVIRDQMQRDLARLINKPHVIAPK